MPLFTQGVSPTDPLLSATEELRVKQNPGFGEYSSIATALASITTNSSVNRFVIKVSPGTYTEPELDFASKPYVSLVGSSIQTTVIKPDAANHHIFLLGAFNEISFVWLEDAGTDYAGLAMINSGDYSQAHKVTFNNCSIGVLVESNVADSFFYGEYLDFNGLYDNGVLLISSGGFEAYANVENIYNIPNGGNPQCYKVSGTLAKLDIVAGGNRQLGAQAGTGIIVEDGGFADVSSVYFQNFILAIDLPTGGSAPIAQFTATSLFNNQTDIKVLHASAQGNWQGAGESPVINIISTASFGISYLERTLGNKQEVYYDAWNIAPSAVTVPTAAAATVVNQSSVTGLIAVQYSGTADQNANVNMRIPKDYLSGGRFKISWSTSNTSGNNIVFAPIISVKQLNDSLITITETLTPQVLPAGTINLLQNTSFFTPTTTFVPGHLVILRVTRPASSNASDTQTQAIFVNGVIFEYNSSK